MSEGEAPGAIPSRFHGSDPIVEYQVLALGDLEIDIAVVPLAMCPLTDVSVVLTCAQKEKELKRQCAVSTARLNRVQNENMSMRIKAESQPFDVDTKMAEIMGEGYGLFLRF
jgi:hypothetical protein